jgi:HlyD family secretion protein
MTALRALRPIALFAVCATTVCAATSCARSDRFPFSGTVIRDAALVGSTVGGRVTSVRVAAGDSVRAGEILVTFDDADERAAVAAAQAQARQAAANYDDLAAGPLASETAQAEAQAAQSLAAYDQALLGSRGRIASARASARSAADAYRQAAAQADLAEKTARRQSMLYAQGAISAQASDEAVAGYRSAVAAMAAARARLQDARAQAAVVERADVPEQTNAAAQSYQASLAHAATVRAGARPQTLAAAHYALQAAQAQLAAQSARLAQCVVRAPADGTISAIDLRPGDIVAPNVGIATVEERHNPYVRIYVDQADIGRFSLRAKVDVRSDAVPGRTFTGTIEQIDSAAQFTPRDVETPEDRASLTFGVKVRIDDPGGVVRAGTTASVALP